MHELTGLALVARNMVSPTSQPRNHLIRALRVTSIVSVHLTVTATVSVTVPGHTIQVYTTMRKPIGAALLGDRKIVISIDNDIVPTLPTLRLARARLAPSIDAVTTAVQSYLDERIRPEVDRYFTHRSLVVNETLFLAGSSTKTSLERVVETELTEILLDELEQRINMRKKPATCEPAEELMIRMSTKPAKPDYASIPWDTYAKQKTNAGKSSTTKNLPEVRRHARLHL